MKRVSFAIRGEIASRVISARRKCGLAAVAAHAQAGRNSLHPWSPDHARLLGGCSFLDGTAHTGWVEQEMLA